MKNIKTFDTHAEYNAYITGSTAVLPNLSYVKGTDEVHTTRVPSLTAIFNVTQTTPITILGRTTNISAVIIDGVKQPTVELNHAFSTIGKHEVKYLLTAATLPESMFDDFESNISFTSAKISNGITEIGDYCFGYCTELTGITIPSSITSIGSAAFYSCSNMTSIVLLPTTPPTLGSSDVFESADIEAIYVPRESVDTYKNAIGWYQYSNLIQPM